MIPTDSSANASAPTGAVLLYDGECGLCAGSVQCVLRFESPRHANALRFAPLQGVFAAGVRQSHPEIASVDTVVWYERDAAGTSRVALRSDAALRALRHLGGGWRLVAMLGRLVPLPVRDAVYDLIARRRLSLAAPACVLPTAAQRQRFLD